MKPGVFYKLAKLGITDTAVTLYIEGINSSAVIGDQQVLVELFPLGGEQFGEYADQLGEYAEDAVRVTVFKVDVDKIAFNYDPSAHNNDALNIREDFAKPITVPEYIKGGQNKPCAYVKDSAVKMLVRLKVNPISITSLKIKGVSDEGAGKPSSLGNAAEKEVVFVNGISHEGVDDPATVGIDESEYSKFDIIGNTPKKIYRSEEAWAWKATALNGVAISDTEVDRTSRHIVYVLWDEPQAPWGTSVATAADQVRNPWVKALEFATKNCGAHDKEDAAGLAAITGYLHTGHGMKYDTVNGAPAYNLGMKMDISGYIDKKGKKNINCYDQAGAVTTLGTLLGVKAEYKYMEPFGYISKIDLVGVGQCNNPFYMNPIFIPPPPGLPSPIVGNNVTFPNRSSFGNHAFVEYGGKVFDACAGPCLGTQDEAKYLNSSIDKSTPAEASVAGNSADIKDDIISDLN